MTCADNNDDAATAFSPGFFDAITCHTLVEYVPGPQDLLQALVATLKPGGLLSLLAVNPHSDALRWALAKGDLEQAHQALGQTRSSTTLFGINRHVYTGETLRQTLAELGMESVATYGVRIFADYLPAEKLADPVFFASLVELEMAAGSLVPYKLIARYSQLLGQKSTS